MADDAAEAQLVGMICDYVIDETIRLVTMVSTEAVAATILNAKRVTSGQLRGLAEVFQEGLFPEEIEKANRDIMLIGRKSMLYSFRATKGRSVPGYRAGANGKYKRYAGNKLYNALASDSFFMVDSKGITFNLTMLSREAKQWARLNFGAGAKGRGSRPTKQVYVGAMLVAALGFEEGPRPAMRMPAGYFVNAGGQPVGGRARPGQFIPLGQSGVSIRRKGSARANSKGETSPIRLLEPQFTSFEGRQFLDAGLWSMAEAMGPIYQELYKDLYRRGALATRNYSLPNRTTVVAR